MPLYAVTIFLSAFLLFLVQPILAKQILPWYGGTAVVWTTCMVFFQLVLLLGYSYAHWITTHVTSPLQNRLHIGLLVVSLVFMPIVADAAWKPGGEENPVVRILLLLFTTIGLPYFLLSSTSPLLQAWFAREHPGASPYRLFALSNFASMLALLGYPLLFEPAFALPGQSNYWSVGYAGFVVLCAVLAWRSRKLPAMSVEGGQIAATADEPAPRARQIGLWLTLSTLGSITLLAVSNHLTQNVSSIPLLWVVPLAVYLLTFILCFEGRDWYKRDVYLGFLVWIVCVMGWFLADKNLHFELLWNLAVFVAGLFFVCMFCHGELAMRRPGARHLTLFYLVVSLGGVLGGVLVGIVAPIALPGYLELEIAIVVIAHVALAMNLSRPYPIVAMFAVAAVFTTGALVYRVHHFMQDTIHIERNYYGVMRVKEIQVRDDDAETRYRSLVHGGILHGEQWLAEKYRRAATTYYKPDSGVGKAILALEGQAIHVGVIGLGTGTLAAYGDADDTYRFYDINPAVERIARKYFTFLSDTPAKVDVVLGDARLQLEREPAQAFDVLAVDAFSGDSIPVHLITYEAVGAFLRHMKPDGVIAYHVSNRFLDLKPVLLAIAEKHGLEFAFIDQRDKDGGTTSDWILLSRNKAMLLRPTLVESTEPVVPQPGLRLWTDAYSNLIQVFKN